MQKTNIRLIKLRVIINVDTSFKALKKWKEKLQKAQQELKHLKRIEEFKHPKRI